MKILHAALLCAFIAIPVNAAPAPDESKTPAPQIVAQAQSIDQLMGKVKTALKSFVSEKEFAHFEKETLSSFDSKNLPGIDPKRPFGFYATLDAGLLQGSFEKSSAVLMIPILSEKEFVGLLEKAKVPLEKKDGFYAINLPNSPMQPIVRFHQDYAYVGFAGKNLELKSLLDPKAVISAAETAAFVMKVRIDQIPQELKDAANQLVDQSFNQMKEAPSGVKAKACAEQFTKLMSSWLKTVLADGHEVVKRVDLDAKTAELIIESTLDGKPDSDLAKIIRALPPTKNDFLDIVGKDSVAHGLMELPLFTESLRNLLHAYLEATLETFNGLGKEMPEKALAAGTDALQTLARTVKSGQMSMAASLRGPNKEGFFSAIAAIQLKDTAALEKSLREAVPLTFARFQKALKLDAGKINGSAVHELDLQDSELPPSSRKAFGKNPKIYILFAPNALYLAIGTDGMAFLKEALTAKGGASPLVNVEMDPKRMVQFIDGVTQLGQDSKQFMERVAKRDRFPIYSLHVSGGTKLTIQSRIGFIPVALYFFVSARAPAPEPAQPNNEPAPVQKVKE